MKQQRNTRQRQIIWKAVQARQDHPSADQIYLDVRETDDRISRGTVYRNLNQLAESGDILHVRIPGVDRFDCRIDLHYHLLCTECGRVSDLELPYDDKLDRLTGAATGYRIQRHRTVFEGMCPECLKKIAGQASGTLG